MDIKDLIEVLLTLALYGFCGYIFVSFVAFIMKEVAPKVMSGRMTLREYISLLGGSILVLGMLAFGPYYLGTALMYGWEQFKPIIPTVTGDIVGDFYNITSGDTTINIPSGQVDVYHPDNPAMIPTPIMPQAVPVVYPTPTLAPTATATPFAFGEWTPDQPAPTPGG